MKKPASHQLDVAIVGGGVAGAYCGWRLTSDKPKLKTALFEYGQRIGGRLFSATLPGAKHVPCELGGMRIIKGEQPFVENTVKQMALKTAPFLMGNPDPKIADTLNICYLRNKHLLVPELSDSAKIPYNVSWGERNMNPDQLQAYVMNLLIPQNASLTPTQWFDVEVFGKKLYEFGYWNLLYRVLTPEAYAFMRDACGYEANVANANSVLQLPTTDYTDQTQYLKLVDGYQGLPIKLAETFVQQGGQLELNRRLALIEPAQRGAKRRYKLTFVQTETDDNDRTHDVPGAAPVIVYADKVVLAMPRRSIELIEWKPLDDPKVQDLLSSVLIQKAFKLFFAYREPWWKALGLVAGRAITDLPVRQVYYFGIEGENHPKGDPKNALNSVLMGSYCDIGSVPFWKGLEVVKHDDPFVGEEREAPAPIAYSSARKTGTAVAAKHLPYRASKQMVAAAQKQIEEVHGQVELPKPYAAIYHEWSDDPYGGGWHEWKAGYQYFDVMKKVRHPVAGQDVFICGEAYSNNQGWVEGSLQTAEHVLEDHLGLKRPSWLPPDADMGP
jgi:monoamine oxidase